MIGSWREKNDCLKEKNMGNKSHIAKLPISILWSPTVLYCQLVDGRCRKAELLVDFLVKKKKKGNFVQMRHSNELINLPLMFLPHCEVFSFRLPSKVSPIQFSYSELRQIIFLTLQTISVTFMRQMNY